MSKRPILASLRVFVNKDGFIVSEVSHVNAERLKELCDHHNYSYTTELYDAIVFITGKLFETQDVFCNKFDTVEI